MLNRRSRGLAVSRVFCCVGTCARMTKSRVPATACVMYVCPRIPVPYCNDTCLVTRSFNNLGIPKEVSYILRINYEEEPASLLTHKRRTGRDIAKEITLHNNVIFEGQI